MKGYLLLNLRFGVEGYVRVVVLQRVDGSKIVVLVVHSLNNTVNF